MKKILLFLLFPSLLFSQTDYELEFNSATQDYVQISNISAMIANQTAFSMSCWINPQSSTDHSGIMGFRNNTDADFYLLQMQNSNTIEARFRGSSGVNYDIVATNLLDFNQWQHLAFTYDGSYIRLYKDGALVDSSVANGIIGQNTLPLQLGKLDWGISGFFMTGRLDEIRLWDVALSQTEINSWMCIPIDLTHPNYSNLMGYWKLNEGTGTIITDLSVNGNNGTLINNPIWKTSTTCLGNTTPVLKTYVPDNNFENYLEANGMGDGISLNDSVFKSAIDTVTILDVSNQNISDLTGIEDFMVLTELICEDNQLTSLDISGNTALTHLKSRYNQLTSLDISNNIALTYLECDDNHLTSLDVSNNTALTSLSCSVNQLTSLDVSNNTALIELDCFQNQLTSLDVSNNTSLTALSTRENYLTALDVSQNIALIGLGCDDNQLTSLDVSNNTSLEGLECFHNQLTSLDVSNNTALTTLYCDNNQLTSLDLRNGNNTNLNVSIIDNANLTCIDVDDVLWSSSNWTVLNGNIDIQHYFSANCSGGTVVEESTTRKEILRTVDVLGKELQKFNQPLFYIYNDGTVEKKIIVE